MTKNKREGATSKQDQRPFSPDEKGAYVRRMFSAIAGRYDLMNRLMTGGMDGRWRRIAVDEARPEVAAVSLDLCAGTGDLAFALVRASRGPVVALDYCQPMVEIGQRKARARGMSDVVTFVVGDAQRIPLVDGSVSAVTMGFGLRNVSSIERTFAEVHRVLAPGGRFACLETVMPTSRVARGVHALYFRRLVPLLGRLVAGDYAAYHYLPHSVRFLPAPDELMAMLQRAGFADVRRRSLAAGGVMVYVATRAV